MGKKTISNTFSVNTIQDGEDAVVATCSPDKISIQCNADGSVVSTNGYSVSFGLKVGGIDISQYITDVTRGSLPTGVSISSTPVAYAKTIVVSNTATATGMTSGITFTVSASYSGKTYSANVTVALIGAVQGGQGERGRTGRFYYYGGDWNANNNTKKFVIDDAQTVYFSKAGSSSNQYYLFDYIADSYQEGGYTMYEMWNSLTVKTGEPAAPSWNNEPWEVMTNDFKYLITEAIFANNAKLGSFIISGDWMFSQFGILYSANGTAYLINSTRTVVFVDGEEYGYTNSYLKFDANYPNSSKPNEINFCPFLADDGLTGVTYRQRGNIGGFVINSTQIKSTNEKIILNSDGSAKLVDGNFEGVVRAAMMYGTQLTVINPNTSVKKYALDLVNHPANLFMCDPAKGKLVIVLPQAGEYDGITIRFFAEGATASKTVTLQTYNSSVNLYFKDMDNYVVGSWQQSNAMKMLNHEPYEASAIDGEWYITQGIGKFGTYVS